MNESNVALSAEKETNPANQQYSPAAMVGFVMLGLFLMQCIYFALAVSFYATLFVVARVIH